MQVELHFTTDSPCTALQEAADRLVSALQQSNPVLYSTLMTQLTEEAEMQKLASNVAHDAVPQSGHTTRRLMGLESDAADESTSSAWEPAEQGSADGPGMGALHNMAASSQHRHLLQDAGMHAGAQGGKDHQAAGVEFDPQKQGLSEEALQSFQVFNDEQGNQQDAAQTTQQQQHAAQGVDAGNQANQQGLDTSGFDADLKPYFDEFGDVEQDIPGASDGDAAGAESAGASDADRAAFQYHHAYLGDYEGKGGGQQALRRTDEDAHTWEDEVYQQVRQYAWSMLTAARLELHGHFCLCSCLFSESVHKKSIAPGFRHACVSLYVSGVLPCKTKVHFGIPSASLNNGMLSLLLQAVHKYETDFVYVDSHILCTPAIADIDADGHDELVISVSYFFDKDYYDNPEHAKELHFSGVLMDKYVAGERLCRVAVPCGKVVRSHMSDTDSFTQRCLLHACCVVLCYCWSSCPHICCCVSPGYVVLVPWL